MARSRRDPWKLVEQTIDAKYRVLEVIGEGGFSVVYKAEHLLWRQPVALKCLKVPPEHQARSSDLLDAFLREGRLMAALSTQSTTIVQARDVGTLTTPSGERVPYLALEWLDGPSLAAVLRAEAKSGRPPRTLPAAMALLDPVAHALSLAHAQGIAHCDLKPAHVVVLGDPDRAPVLKVLDFGIARVMGERPREEGGEIHAYTPNYAAPEHLDPRLGRLGPWTDVFALALILVEVLRPGRHALEGDSHYDVMCSCVDPARRPTPRALGIEVPWEVDRVFLRALAVRPEQRYPTARAFWSDLAAALAASRHGASPASGTWSTQAPSGRPPMAESIPPPAFTTAASPRRASLGKPLAFLVALATVGAGALGAAHLLRGGRGPSAVAVQPDAATPSLALGAGSASSTGTGAGAAATTCPDGAVLVPGGSFFMGSDEPGNPLWRPAHRVVLSTFCLDASEVTVADYASCSDRGRCKRPPRLPEYPKVAGDDDASYERKRRAYGELCNFGVEGRERHPVNCVSWDLADAFCRASGKRLPTEAEWEFAARGSDGRVYPWGDDPGGAGFFNACGAECKAWERDHDLSVATPQLYRDDDGFAGTAPVGSFPKGDTQRGAHDMVGNVWEWTADWYDVYGAAEATNPKGAPAGERKAIRGGGFNGGAADWVNPAFRYHQLATASSPAIGFRCAADLGGG